MHKLPRRLLVPCCLLALLPAQSRTVVPTIAERLPGNAALSLPLRWSQGTLVVSIDAALLPLALTGQAIHGLRLRRPTFLGEPAYPAVQRTITVRAAFGPTASAQLSATRSANWPAGTPASGLPILAGPATFPVAQTALPVAPQATGDEFLVIAFAAPLPVVAGNLLLEFEVASAQFAIDSQWVDAVWSVNGVESGFAVTVGDGACTPRTRPIQLTWNAPQAPTRGSTASIVLAGALPSIPVFLWLGLDPQNAPVGPSFFGFGAGLLVLDPSLQGCSQWIPVASLWNGITNGAGGMTLSFPIPAGITQAGQQIGMQAAALDTARTGVPLDITNGLVMALDRTGLGSRCATMLIPGTASQSPWLPNVGLMPVLVIEY
ncbi:MAG: hypothetical protein EXS02_11870 [Planctomycetes bacterium]|nr:hypothetical protein [Planctomycetota bacterium]